MQGLNQGPAWPHHRVRHRVHDGPQVRPTAVRAWRYLWPAALVVAAAVVFLAGVLIDGRDGRHREPRPLSTDTGA